MKEINKTAIILYLKLTLLATFLFANVIQTTVFGMFPCTQDYATLMLTYSLPMEIPYGNIVSIIYVFISWFILS